MILSILNEITQKIRVGEVLTTPSGRSNFRIYHIDANGIRIRIGRKKNILFLPASCFEGVPDFLKGKGWIRIGAIHDVAYQRTFDSYVQRFTHGTSAASYVAPILERVSIVEIDRRRPARIRLKASNY